MKLGVFQWGMVGKVEGGFALEGRVNALLMQCSEGWRLCVLELHEVMQENVDGTYIHVCVNILMISVF